MSVHKSLEKNLPFLIDTFSNSTLPLEDRWTSVIQDFFPEAKLESASLELQKSQLAQSSLTIEIPCIRRGNGYFLHAKAGANAFSQKDLDLVNAVLRLAQQFISIEDAVEKGASEERQRIARDLHDDVAARMLTLIHTVKDEETIALSRSILKSLRNSIYTLDNKSTVTILDAITDVRAEIQDRLNSIGMQLLWQQDDDLDQLSFTPRQHINLIRMLHEATTNIVRHAQAQYMEIQIECQHQQLIATCCDNGSGFDVEKCIPGKGINNIRTRVQELNGTAEWYTDNNNNSATNKGSCVRICFPLTLPANT